MDPLKEPVPLKKNKNNELVKISFSGCPALYFANVPDLGSCLRASFITKHYPLLIWLYMKEWEPLRSLKICGPFLLPCCLALSLLGS